MRDSTQVMVRDLRMIAALIDSMGADLFGGEPQFLDAETMAGAADALPFAYGLPYFSANRPLIIARIDSAGMAGKVQIALSDYFAPDHIVSLFWENEQGTGISIARVALSALGSRLIEQDMYALVLPVATLDQSRSPLGMHALVAALRSPNGCPWDRAQTHASIRSAVIEEAYEVADAIDEGDAQHLAEELGDLALQVALHAQIALEAGEFSPADVYGHINRKLVRRHPHVFGEESANTPEAVIRTWEGVKAQERAAAGKENSPSDPFDRLPRSMPVLTRVASLYQDAAIAKTHDGSKTDALGDRLLDTVEQLVAAGSNPEAALEQAYRRRAAANIK